MPLTGRFGPDFRSLLEQRRDAGKRKGRSLAGPPLHDLSLSGPGAGTGQRLNGNCRYRTEQSPRSSRYRPRPSSSGSSFSKSPVDQAWPSQCFRQPIYVAAQQIQLQSDLVDCRKCNQSRRRHPEHRFPRRQALFLAAKAARAFLRVSAPPREKHGARGGAETRRERGDRLRPGFAVVASCLSTRGREDRRGFVTAGPPPAVLSRLRPPCSGSSHIPRP